MNKRDDFDQISPLMDDCRMIADTALSRLSAMAGADTTGHAQKAYIEAVGDAIQLSLSYLDGLSSVTESLMKKLRQVQ